MLLENRGPISQHNLSNRIRRAPYLRELGVSPANGSCARHRWDGSPLC